MTSCYCLSEAGAGNTDGVVAQRDGVELKFAVGVGVDGLGPVRRLCLQHYHGTLNGAMLRVMHYSADGAIDVSKSSNAGE